MLPELIGNLQTEGIVGIVNVGKLLRGVMKIAHVPRRSKGELVVRQQESGSELRRPTAKSDRASGRRSPRRHWARR